MHNRSRTPFQLQVWRIIGLDKTSTCIKLWANKILCLLYLLKYVNPLSSYHTHLPWKSTTVHILRANKPRKISKEYHNCKNELYSNIQHKSPYGRNPIEATKTSNKMQIWSESQEVKNQIWHPLRKPLWTQVNLAERCQHCHLKGRSYRYKEREPASGMPQV